MAKAYVEIPLTKGKVALVDVEDAGRVIAAGPWRAMYPKGAKSLPTDKPYAMVAKTPEDGVWLMHNLVLDAKGVDHINGDTLDNRRENLRVATPKQNAANRGLHPRNTSGYAGVIRRGSSWLARIKINPGGASGGNVTVWSASGDRHEVARLRDEALRSGQYGDPAYAQYNFPEVGEISAVTGETRTI